MRRWLAIVNPASGRASATRRLAARLAATGLADVVQTTAPGDGGRLARAAADYHGIVAVGGDGTIAEALSGMDRARQILALLPTGHGNCLARDLGLADPAVALATLASGVATPVDLILARIGYADGRAVERRCASTLALGYVADVVAHGRLHLAPLGRHAYSVAAVATRPRRMGLRLAAGAPAAPGRRLTGVVINNTAHLANFRAFHAARLDDGRLDALASDFGWGRQLLHNVAVLAGSARFGPTLLWQAPLVTVESDRPTRLMADGELDDGVVRLSAGCERAGVRCQVARR